MSIQKVRKTSLSTQERAIIKQVQQRTRARTETIARNIEDKALMEKLDREQDRDWALVDNDI